MTIAVSITLSSEDHKIMFGLYEPIENEGVSEVLGANWYKQTF